MDAATHRKLTAEEFEAIAEPRTLPPQLTRDDEAAGKLLQHLIDAIAYLEQDKEFAGFVIEPQVNAEGKLLALRLVVHDKLAGIVAPRV